MPTMKDLFANGLLKLKNMPEFANASPEVHKLMDHLLSNTQHLPDSPDHVVTPTEAGIGSSHPQTS